MEAFSVGLGPKLLSYRTPGGEGNFFKGKISGPFASSEDSDDDNSEVEPQKLKEVKKPINIWAWGKKEEEKEVVEEKKKVPEGVEVREEDCT